MAVQSRDKRALALLAGATVLFLLLQTDWLLPAPGGGGGSTESVEAVETAFRLARAKARRQPLVKAESAAAAKALEQIEEGLLASETAALANAEMRQIVEQLLTAEGIAMKSSRFASVELEGDSYARVPLTVDFDCRIEQFVNWMAAVANAPQLLSTRRIEISPGNKETKGIRVRVTVGGYLPASRTPELTEKAAGPGATL